MPFLFKSLKIPDVILVEPKVYSDQRGFFIESFKESDYFKNGIKDKFVQDNFSHSSKCVLRGLHYQTEPKSQAKLVIVLKGKIFDVAVDIRKKSPTFGKWVGEILSEDNHKLLYIPKGFAHGFCILSNDASISYKVSNEYSLENERGIIWNDPEINISWPITNPVLSTKDSELPLLKNSNAEF